MLMARACLIAVLAALPAAAMAQQTPSAKETVDYMTRKYMEYNRFAHDYAFDGILLLPPRLRFTYHTTGAKPLPATVEIDLRYAKQAGRFEQCHPPRPCENWVRYECVDGHKCIVLTRTDAETGRQETFARETLRPHAYLRLKDADAADRVRRAFDHLLDLNRNALPDRELF